MRAFSCVDGPRLARGNAACRTEVACSHVSGLFTQSGWTAGVCTENLILFDYVTESPNVNGDDRAALLLPDPVRLAVQVEEPTCGTERGAPTSADHFAAEGARSRPSHECGSLVLGHTVSMVPIGPQGHHDHPAADPCALAPG